MTLISSLVTSNGILLASDSIELITGGALLWSDFNEILQRIGKSEDEESSCISPLEIKKKFQDTAKKTNSRIRNFEGVEKIFKISDYSALQVAGKVSFKNKELGEIIREIKTTIKSDVFSQLENKAFEILKTSLDNEQDDIEDCEYLFSGYNRETKEYLSHKFRFVKQLILDENNKMILNEDGRPKEKMVFSISPHNLWFNLAGWKEYFTDFNKLNFTLNKENLTLEKAFDLTQKVFELAIVIEKISNPIYGIGGQIKYAIINCDGFRRISNKTDIMNL